MSANLKNFEKLTTQKLARCLDHLVIGLVDKKCTKLGKIGENLLLILGLAHTNLPLCQPLDSTSTTGTIITSTILTRIY